MNELEALEQLTKLIEIIELNNWEHLYRNISAYDDKENEIIELKLEVKEYKSIIKSNEEIFKKIKDMCE